MLVAGLIYFVEDVLRRKIRINENFIRLGYSSYRLSELSSVGLVYKPKRTLPSDLLLYFGAGKKLELSLARLSCKEFESMVTLIENRFPQCSIEPVITTLIKSKKVARKAAMDEADRTVIVYQSRRAIKELWQTFMDTAHSWSRLGPSVAAFLFAPVWLTVIKGWYGMPVAFRDMDKVALHEKLMSILQTYDMFIADNLSKGSTFLYQIVSNPLVILCLSLFLIPFLYYLCRFVFLPNRLVLDSVGLQLVDSVGSFWQIPMAQANWGTVAKAYLSKPSETAGPETWSICMENEDGKPVFQAQLAAISQEDRTRLSKAIERWAPQCALAPDLAETLMPPQAKSYTELWLQSLAAPPERASLEPLSQGRVLQDGRYEVVRRLGIGGQGAAYLCKERTDTQPATYREVVLKETIIPVFVESAIRKQALERFEQEATILRNLDSEFIVKLLDYFVEDHRGYLVLELVDGKSLRQLVEDRGALPDDTVLDLAQQMCRILQYLHGKSVIHRDFTPDNLILQKDGKLRLIDFNVAQNEEEGSSGVVVGKQSYLPPEQFRGKPTSQSDIYAMGATLYFLLTGSDPEPISQSDVVEAKSNVSAVLAQIVRGATVLDLSKRYKTVAEIQDAITKESNFNGEDDDQAMKIKFSTKERKAQPVEVQRNG